MYAVIKTGGKQYRVENGDIIEVEKLPEDAGSTVSLSPVLMFNDDKASKVGNPVIEGAAVSAEVLEQTRGDKIIVFKKKRRKGYQRKNGHRQWFTEVEFQKIKASTLKTKKATPKKEVSAVENSVQEEE